MADCAALEMLCPGNRTGGSNPPLSAFLARSRLNLMAVFFLALKRRRGILRHSRPKKQAKLQDSRGKRTLSIGDRLL